MSNILQQSSLYVSMLDKIENIKNNLNKIKDYTNISETKDTEYLTDLVKFSESINNIESLSEDLLDKYIMQTEPSILSHEELQLRKKLLINKKIQDTFMPYMLYMQLLLQNN